MSVTSCWVLSAIDYMFAILCKGTCWNPNPHQAPLFTEFSRQEYWSGLPFPSPLTLWWSLELETLGGNQLTRVEPTWMGLKVKVKSLSSVRLFATPWTVAYQAPSSIGFSRQEYWNGLPFSFSRGSSRPRVRNQVSHIPGRCFNLWATRDSKKGPLSWLALFSTLRDLWRHQQSAIWNGTLSRTWPC